MTGFFRAPRELWPAVAEALPRPWADEWVELDCAYWRGEHERAAKGYRSALPRRRPSARWFAARWGWTTYRTRQLLRDIDPLSTSATRNRTNVDTESNSFKRVNADNGAKLEQTSTRNRTNVDTKSTTRAIGTDLIPHTHTSHSPPTPPAGGDLVRAVCAAMAADPAAMSAEDWCAGHALADVYSLASEADAEELRAAMLADQPTRRMTLDEVVETMRRQGWRGSGRNGRATRADCQAVARAMEQGE